MQVKTIIDEDFTNYKKPSMFIATLYIVNSGTAWNKATFKKSAVYGLNLRGFEASSLLNSPNLSILPLLAYHKICNDHYRNEKWQPYNASLCNVDYLTPNTSSLLSIDDALLAIPDSAAKADQLNLLDMRFSNLPLDYFTGVLPTSQFGSESVVNLNHGSAPITVDVTGETFPDTGKWSTVEGNILPQDKYVPVKTSPGNTLTFDDPSPVSLQHRHHVGLSGKIDSSTLSGNLSIIALRNAIAVQRYKEIQLANDVDFSSQIFAHFGIQPNDKDENSLFIGGSSSMININEQINQNLSPGNKAYLS